MRAIVQRVSYARVTVETQIVGQIEQGLLVLLGVEEADTSDDIEWLAAKLSSLRIFADENGIGNLSVTDIEGEILVVSQFTLHASTKKGNRPSYIRAAKPEFANLMYENFCQTLSSLIRKPLQKGIFGAMMQVELCNDGPVTIFFDTKNKE